MEQRNYAAGRRGWRRRRSAEREVVVLLRPSGGGAGSRKRHLVGPKHCRAHWQRQAFRRAACRRNARSPIASLAAVTNSSSLSLGLQAEQRRGEERRAPSSSDSNNKGLIEFQKKKKTRVAAPQSSPPIPSKCRPPTQRADVVIGFANADGLVAWGCLWSFQIDLTAHDAVADGSVPAHRFWSMMAASGATHDPRTVWLTCHGGPELAWLMKSSLSPATLPAKWTEYLQLRSACFPSLYDIGLIAHWCKDIEFRSPGCKGKIGDLALALGVADANATPDPALRALLLMRCFLKLSGLTNFTRIAKSVRNKVMASCCWACGGRTDN